MLRSYLKLGYRNVIRNKLTSTINLVGLSMALGVAISIFAFVEYQYNMDSFQQNIDRIYQITNLVKENTDDLNDANWGDSPMFLGPALLNDNPAIESFTRIEYGSGSMRYNEQVFNESIWFVDPGFMSMLSFKVLYGNPESLKNKNEIIITQKISEKYFGEQNPVGETFSIKFTNDEKEEFIIGAVLATLPGNSSLRFHNLISMEAFESLNIKDLNDLEYFTDATFIMLKDGHKLSEVSDGMEKYKEVQNEANTNWPISGFRFYPLTTLSRNNGEIQSEVSQGASAAGIITLGAISLMLLLLACFNYMNVAIATVTTRLKEIGIRKVIGGRKKEIITQFLVENLVLCTGSLLTGVLLAYLFFMPGLNSLFPIEVSFANANPVDLVVFFSCILVFVALISGAYPAFYIASFQPVQILSGRGKFGAKGWFSKSLLTIQFTLAFTTIIGSFVFINNSLGLRDKDWGYAHAQNYVVPVSNYTTFIAMRDFAAQHKNILSFAGTQQHIGARNKQVAIKVKEAKKQVVLYEVGFNYLETMNLRLAGGRFFDESIQSDKTESVVINSVFAAEMGWENPLGKSFEYDSVRHYVVGVVEKFHYYDFYAAVDPVMFLIGTEEEFNYLVIKIRSGSLMEADNELKTAWQQVAPDDPYRGYFQDKVFEGFQNDNNANVKLLVVISFITILLACMGLFGLVSYSITRRMKEFSIRKVLGAGIGQIFKLMNQDYMWILLIAFGLGAPLGFISINSLIEIIYPDPNPASATPFLLGIIIMIITVALTISAQIGRVIRNNPSEALRIE